MQRTRKSPAPRSRFPRPGAGPAGPPEYICRSRFRYSHLVEKRFQQGKTVIFDTKQRFLLFLALIIARFLRNASIFSHIFGYISVSLVQNVQESVPLRLTVFNLKTFVLDTRIFGVPGTSGPRRSEISVFLFWFSRCDPAPHKNGKTQGLLRVFPAEAGFSPALPALFPRR